MPKPRSNNGPSTNKDIRSFFSLNKQKQEKPSKVDLIEDDDVIPESPDVQIKLKKKQSRKKRVLEDSSDEEIFTSKKSKTTPVKNEKPKKDKIVKAELKEVKAVDIFGSGPIKRTEPIVKKEKKLKTETGIHSDEEFEKSLLELDEPRKSTDSTKSPTKSNGTAVKSEYFNGESEKSQEKKQKTPESKKRDEKETSQKKRDKSESSKKHNKDTDTKKSKKYDESPVKSHISEKHKSDKKESKHRSEIKEKTPNDKDSKEKKQNGKSPAKTHTKVESVEKTESKSKSKSPVKKNDKKRDFSEFISDVVDEPVQDIPQSQSKKKKPQNNKSLNDSVLTDEERHERKRHSAALYQSYMNRSGPKHLGSKEMPEGSPDCLKDCAFLLTGVLDSFEREEIAEAIAKFGGTVKTGISRKVTHLLAGEDSGPAKIAKAQELGIKIINEDEFLDMIKDRSKKKTAKEPNDSKTDNKTSLKTPKEKSDSKKKSKVSPQQMKSFEDKIKSSFYSKETSVKKDSASKQSKASGDVKMDVDKQVNVDSVKKDPSTSVDMSSEMWVEKYKPQNVKQIIGQHGDASNVKKLTSWLTKWYVSRKEKIPKPSPWAKNDDGAYYKAALLSGPPGVGKTTTVSLVCKELGFDTVEFNASDTRNKTLIREQIGELLSTNSLSGFSKGDTGKKAVSKKHVLVMDEVDGMAGNEDRGGLQELIALIKNTSVPVICMCNDRNSEKMRTLVNYCYDLKFSRPRVDQIKSAMLSVCFKEGIKIPADVLTQLIVASNQDVRQTLNSLSVWAADPDNMDPEKLRKDAQNTKKDTKLGPWEAVRKVFSSEDHKTMSINDKSDLFFYDYSITPLFVQENYLSVVPHCNKNETLDRISKAADSISAGDLVEAKIRRSQAWNLLPLQAMYSTVIPGTMLSGHVAGQIQFPGWLGKNSRANKMKRLAQEIHAHTRLSTSGSKSSIFLDYCTHLRDAIVTPLIKEKSDGINQSIEVLTAYNLLREDLDSLSELAMWPKQRDPMIMVDSKVKAAMTRTYNKQAPALPHAGASFTRGRGKANDDDQLDGDEDLAEEDSEPENDAMIKVKKKTSSKSTHSDKPSTSKAEKPSTSKADKGKKGKSKK